MSHQLKIAATGDAIVCRPLSIYKEERFLSLFKTIQEADVGFTNFEVVISDMQDGYPAAEYGGMYLVVEPCIVDQFKWAGFNLVSQANNHSVDWGVAGMFSSSLALDEQGIVHAGTGCNLAEARNPAYLDTEKGRVALISSASTFSNFGRAGEARPDMRGRPGLNPLRCMTEIRLEKEVFLNVKSTFEDLGVPMAIGPVTDTRLVLGWEVGGFSDSTCGGPYEGVQIVQREKSELHTKPHEGDLKGIVRAIEDARRMADIVICTHHGHQDDGRNRHVPARFIETYARACIDAGADVFLGHGPHVLRGIEIYRNKPILYSLGNFIFQLEGMKRQGQDFYNRYKLDTEATMADGHDANEYREKTNWKGWCGHAFEAPEWDSFMAEILFDGRQLSGVKLHPATLGFGLPRYAPERGRPMRATPENAKRIIDFVAECSAPYGTKIEFEQGIGMVSLR